MLRKKTLLRCIVSAIVLTVAGASFSKGPTTSGPVQEMDYDVTTDVLLGMPNGAPPLTSFYGALKDDVATAADLGNFALYPPSPCAGTAGVWNAILADPKMHHHERRMALALVLNVMAADTCEVQIVRDESTSPPTIVSITPIPVP